jgi:hypothetical protein
MRHNLYVIGAWALMMLLLSLSPTAGPAYGPWSEPVNLGAPINSSYVDHSPLLSKDGLSLYISSNRPCGEGDANLDFNLWVARRSSEDMPWAEPECLAINIDGYEDSAPAFSRDGHWMFFVSTRPGGLGTAGTPEGRDLWVTWRAHVHDDRAWQDPFNAGAILNTSRADTGPTYFENEGGTPQVFFATNRDGTFDIWVAAFIAGEFGKPTKVTQLSTDNTLEARPAIRYDGLEIYVFRGGLTSNVFDIYVATRSDPNSPWSEPVDVGSPVNTESNEQMPALSRRGDILFFASNRPGTLGNLDVWMSVRDK